MNSDELQKKLNLFQSDLKKKLYFIAYISDLLKKQGKNTPVVIGGLALSYYSREVYSTADIDLSFADMDSIDKILKELKFIKKGRYWINEGLDLALEIPASSLAGEDSPLEEVEVEDNLVCSIIGLEDLIIDRMNACKHWKSRIDCEMTELLLVKYRDTVDWDYIYEKANLPQNDIYNELKSIKDNIDERK